MNKQQNPTAMQRLFELRATRYQLPQLHRSATDDALDEKALFGFALSSPFELLREPITNKLLAAQLKEHIGRVVEIIGYLVTMKPTRTAKGQRMFFGTFLDRAGDWIDTVHFPPAADIARATTACVIVACTRVE